MGSCIASSSLLGEEFLAKVMKPATAIPRYGTVRDVNAFSVCRSGTITPVCFISTSLLLIWSSPRIRAPQSIAPLSFRVSREKLCTLAMVSSPSNSGASRLSSVLSSHWSEEFGEGMKVEDEDDIVDDLPDQFAPTAKKRRTGNYSHQSTPAPLQQPSPEDLGDISSDTAGSVPNSPSEDRLKIPDDDPVAHEQVTVCRWQDCTVGDLENMDNLVQHLQDDHVAGKQTSYACEWHGCQRKGQPHASGYALKAHMRSHTKEKPFYCALPGEKDLDIMPLFCPRVDRV